MKTPLLFSAPLLLALVGIASAGMPETATLARYKDLWLNSPFTSPPAGDEPKPETDPFKDYALIGVSPIGDGSYRVTLINRLSPDERITVDSGKTHTRFSILGVDRTTGNPLDTAVRLKDGTRTGTVRFDEKFLVPVAAKPAAKVASPPTLQSGQPAAARARGPRPRVVQPNP